MATGLGKTITFAQLAKEFIPFGRVMVLSHREELVFQAWRTLRDVTECEPEIEMGENRANIYGIFRSRIIVSTIQAFRVEDREGRKVYEDSGALMDHFSGLTPAQAARLEAAPGNERPLASLCNLLRKHRYSLRVVSRMLVRPLGGALLSLLRLDVAGSRFHLATLRGRVRGYRGAKRSNSSA